MSAATTSSAIDPAHIVVTEPVPGSAYPVDLMYIEMIDGAYIPIGMRKPKGPGPFPLILFATGNGGGGMTMLRDHINTKGWTQDQLLDAGYAVAWMRYRAEVDYAYDRIGKLIESGRQHRQLFNRGPLEYEDAIAVAEYVKTLPYIDGERLGYIGVSHGGEMALKIASEYHGFKAFVASEPASHEFLRLRPDETAHVDPKTGLLNVEKMLMREATKVRPRITEDVARARIAPIDTPFFVQGRDDDELQGIFRVSYDLLHEMGKDAIWKSYDHHLHGFIYPVREADGTYAPDAVQLGAFADTKAFFDKYLKRRKRAANRTVGAAVIRLNFGPAVLKNGRRRAIYAAEYPPQENHLSHFRSPDVLERRNNAAAVKKAMLEKFKAAIQDPALEEQRLKRIAIQEAREARMAEREAARKVREAELAVLAAAEAERQAKAKREAEELEAMIEAEKLAAHEALLAEQKAARDARYAARKAAKKERRRGY
jgi:dienelactone hydrolase